MHDAVGVRESDRLAHLLEGRQQACLIPSFDRHRRRLRTRLRGGERWLCRPFFVMAVDCLGQRDAGNQHERHLQRNGTVVLKFFLHMSKREQKKRFLARLDEQDKTWKFSADDVRERIGAPEGSEVVAYCHSGSRSGTAVAVLRASGYAARNYPGSWHEWSADPALPVESGPS